MAAVAVVEVTVVVAAVVTVVVVVTVVRRTGGAPLLLVLFLVLGHRPRQTEETQGATHDGGERTAARSSAAEVTSEGSERLWGHGSLLG